MKTDDDNLTSRISQIDPALSDPEPAEGSIRYRAILETAMRSSHRSDRCTRGVQTGHRPRRKRRLLIAAVAATIAVAVSLGVVIPQILQPVAYADVIHAAAVRLGEADTARGTKTVYSSTSYDNGQVDKYYVDGTLVYGDVTYFTESYVTETFAINGADRQKNTIFWMDGREWAVLAGTIIGDQIWVDFQELDGEIIEKDPQTDKYPGGVWPPFTEASQALLEAALTDASIVLVGTEEVRGVPATHYRLDQSDGWSENISGLSQGVRSWFDIEEPYREIDSSTVTVDVWVADGLIVRLAIDKSLHYPPYHEVAENGARFDEDGYTSHSNVVTEYFDYGADIRIEPPAGSQPLTGSK